MFATSVAKSVILLEIVVARMFVLKDKWPQGEKLLQMSKVDKLKPREVKVQGTTGFMLSMVDRNWRMCPML